MLYEMLSGKLPFDGDGAVSIAIMQISDKAKPLAQVAPNVPEALCQITEKSHGKGPGKPLPERPGNAGSHRGFQAQPLGPLCV